MNKGYILAYIDEMIRYNRQINTDIRNGIDPIFDDHKKIIPYDVKSDYDTNNLRDRFGSLKELQNKLLEQKVEFVKSFQNYIYEEYFENIANKIDERGDYNPDELEEVFKNLFGDSLFKDVFNNVDKEDSIERLTIKCVSNLCD